MKPGEPTLTDVVASSFAVESSPDASWRLAGSCLISTIPDLPGSGFVFTIDLSRPHSLA